MSLTPLSAKQPPQLSTKNSIQHNKTFSQKYEKLQFLGKGTFGLVYKVRDKLNSKIYAAKIISLVGMSQKQILKADTERVILNSLHHPNVIRFYQTYLDLEGQQFIFIMEYCQYGDLSFYIKKREKSDKLPEQVILNIFIQILHGIHYLHNHSIIHRDIKPANIFVDSYGRVKIADFGISKVMDNDQTYNMSDSGSQLEKTEINASIGAAPKLAGTPLYSCPQIIRNQSPTFKSDIWSMGCVLFELCCLKHAFQANNVLALATKINNQNVDDIDMDLYSEDLNALVHWMLEKDPHNRPKASDILQLSYVKKYIRIFQPTKLNSTNSNMKNTVNEQQSTYTPRISNQKKTLSQFETPKKSMTHTKSLNSTSSSLSNGNTPDLGHRYGIQNKSRYLPPISFKTTNSSHLYSTNTSKYKIIEKQQQLNQQLQSQNQAQCQIQAQSKAAGNKKDTRVVRNGTSTHILSPQKFISQQEERLYYANLQESCINLLGRQQFEQMYRQIHQLLNQQSNVQKCLSKQFDNSLLFEQLQQVYGQEYYELAKAVLQFVQYQSFFKNVQKNSNKYTNASFHLQNSSQISFATQKEKGRQWDLEDERTVNGQNFMKKRQRPQIMQSQTQVLKKDKPKRNIRIKSNNKKEHVSQQKQRDKLSQNQKKIQKLQGRQNLKIRQMQIPRPNSNLRRDQNQQNLNKIMQGIQMSNQ